MNPLDHLWLLIPLLLATGACAGLLAGLLGVGGGIVIVPMLFHLFTGFGVETTLAMPLAVGTSLSTIVLTSIVAPFPPHRCSAPADPPPAPTIERHPLQLHRQALSCRPR